MNNNRSVICNTSKKKLCAVRVSFVFRISSHVFQRVQTSSAVSDADFVQKAPAPKQPPSVLPKTRKQSPSPIRSVRMSPPRVGCFLSVISFTLFDIVIVMIYHSLIKL